MHLDDLVRAGREVLTDVVGADRKLSMTAVDENGQPDRTRTSQIEQGVERGPDRAARVEHVVDDDHDAAVDVTGHGGRFEAAGAAEGDVVAVEGHVQGAAREIDTLEAGDRGGDPL